MLINYKGTSILFWIIGLLLGFSAGLRTETVWSTNGSGSIESGRAKMGTCISCHQQDGNSPDPQWPKLGGQHANYLADQLFEFKKGESGKRNDPTMRGFAEQLSEQDIWDLSFYFASQTPNLGKANVKLVELGQVIYRKGILSKNIPACGACHGINGAGLDSAGFPRLSGQHALYVAEQLKNYRSGLRSNGPNNIMNDVSANLSDAEIDAVSSYVQGLH